MLPFWHSLLFIALAEMGDKTQLVALSFATRLAALTVLGGVFVATLLVHLLSVSLGGLLGLALPQFWVAVASGLTFIAFGLWMLRGHTVDGPNLTLRQRFGPLLTVAAAFFLAELGDKSMLATVALASQHQAFVQVWLGSTLGTVIAAGLAIALGRLARRRLPERAIRFFAASAFILFGLLSIGQATFG